jgi:hypothetical protein
MGKKRRRMKAAVETWRTVIFGLRFKGSGMFNREGNESASGSDVSPG